MAVKKPELPGCKSGFFFMPDMTPNSWAKRKCNFQSVQYSQWQTTKKLQYFRDNFDRMKYDEYSLNGWFVGSEAAESACKCVVQQRLDRWGMHWSLKGVPFINGLKVAE